MDSVRMFCLYNLTFNIIMIEMLHVDGYNGSKIVFYAV